MRRQVFEEDPTAIYLRKLILENVIEDMLYDCAEESFGRPTSQPRDYLAVEQPIVESEPIVRESKVSPRELDTPPTPDRDNFARAQP